MIWKEIIILVIVFGWAAYPEKKEVSNPKEQIGGDRRWVNAPWKWIKKQYSRARRRDEKKLGEAAYKKNQYSGWVG